MSNSKSNETVTGNPQEAIKVTYQSNQQEKSPTDQRGQGSFTSKGHLIFILKPHFMNKLTTEKNT